MQGTQYATKRSILCRGAFCGPTVVLDVNYPICIIMNINENLKNDRKIIGKKNRKQGLENWTL